MLLGRLKGLSTFKRGFASTFVLDVVARAMNAVTLVLLLRALPVADFAFMILLLNVGRFMGSAATGGLRLRYVRTEAERVSRGRGEPSSFYLTLRNGSLLVLGAAAIGFAIATALDVGTPEERLTFTLIGTAFTLGHAAVELSIFHYQAQLAFTKGGLVSALRGGVQLVLALGVTAGLLTTGEEVGVAFAVGVGALALIVTAPLAWSTRKSTADKEGRLGFGRESTALTLYSLASASWAYLTVFLVAALLDDAAVAAFGTAARYVAIITGPVPAIVSVLRVRTAQHDMVESETAQLALMVSWAKRAALPLLVVLGGAAIAAPFLLPVIDAGKYPLAIPVFEVMLVMAFAQLITLPNSSLLITQKRYTLLAWVNTAAVLVNIPLAIAVAPEYGVVGIAAAATLVSIGQVTAVTYLAAHPPARSRAREVEVTG